MVVLYSTFIAIFHSLLKVISPFHTKVGKMVKGRRKTFKSISNASLNKDKRVWFHCSSLGEFEMARPIIEKLKNQDVDIIITFYSPSGFEIRKSYDLADCIVYLPFDSASNAKKFYDLVRPTHVIFVKYDLWYFYIREGMKRSIPLFLINANFRSNQYFFKNFGGFGRSILKMFSEIFVLNENSVKLLSSIGVKATVSGDTRFDRVLAERTNLKEVERVKQFKGNNQVLVLGSVWPQDMEVISAYINQMPSGWKIVVAPHEVNSNHVKEIESFCEKATTRFSDDGTNADILLVDNVGYLSAIYQYANIAYVGGAFKTGLHNILEPSTFGIPVIFGPKTEKFPEAKGIQDYGGGFSISNSSDFKRIMNQLIEDKEFYRSTCEGAFTFVNTNVGATDKVINKLTYGG